MCLSSFQSKQVLGSEAFKTTNDRNHTSKRGQSQLLHMSHQFEMHNEKQVNMGDIKGGMGVLGPVLPMKLAL